MICGYLGGLLLIVSTVIWCHLRFFLFILSKLLSSSSIAIYLCFFLLIVDLQNSFLFLLISRQFSLIWIKLKRKSVPNKCLKQLPYSVPLTLPYWPWYWAVWHGGISINRRKMPPSPPIVHIRYSKTKKFFKIKPSLTWISRPTSMSLQSSTENSFIKKLKSSGRSLVVFYGSQTGTGEEFAGRLAKEGARYRLKGMVADPEECDMVISVELDEGFEIVKK